MVRKKNTLKKGALNLSRQFIFVEVPVDVVGPEVILWGEAAWWPKDSAMKFIRTSKAELGLGSTYDMRLGGLLGQVWKAEVTKFAAEPGYFVERTFKAGFFKGYETVRAEERANGTRVEYELYYSIPNPLNKLLWNLFCHKLHDANIMKNLEALKKYCLKRMEQEGNQAV